MSIYRVVSSFIRPVKDIPYFTDSSDEAKALVTAVTERVKASPGFVGMGHMKIDDLQTVTFTKWSTKQDYLNFLTSAEDVITPLATARDAYQEEHGITRTVSGMTIGKKSGSVSGDISGGDPVSGDATQKVAQKKK